MARKTHTALIYLGEKTSIRVPVSNAKRDVLINGDVCHALAGQPGVTIGCAMSNVAADNADGFPHPVILAAFTKSIAYIVDKVNKDGMPSHAVRYHHSYGRIVDKNDAATLKKMALEQPELMNRSFTLRVPPAYRDASTLTHNTPPTGSGRASSRAKVQRGAVARAIRAGILTEAVARQMKA